MKFIVTLDYEEDTTLNDVRDSIIEGLAMQDLLPLPQIEVERVE